MLKIAKLGNPILRKVAASVDPREIKSLELQRLIDEMFETMYDEPGIGLAAPQVGVGLRLFIANLGKDSASAIAVLNPVISELRGSAVEEEGCLSIPGVRAKVKRFASLKLTGTDLNGSPIELDAKDYVARILQHETDHLNGVLFINKIGMTAKLMIRRVLADLEEDYQMAHKRKPGS